MAQSSNYKQYGRATRVLTEESGFAGGMLWTGNNIDETHLKAIVNCDYDDTTGYLKTRDPFTTVEESPDAYNFENAVPNLLGYKLLNAYNICAFDKDDVTLDAGWLYIFTNTPRDGVVTQCHVDNIVCVYNIHGKFYTCKLDVTQGIVLENTTPSNMLINYENQLFGLGRNQGATSPDMTDGSDWLHVYRIEYVPTVSWLDSSNQVQVTPEHYKFKQMSYKEYVKPRIDSVQLLEACTTGFNAARGKDIFTYNSICDDYTPRILGVYFKDDSGNIIVSPRIGQRVTVHVPVAYSTDDPDTPCYLAMFQLKESGDNATTQLEDSWQFEKLGIKSFKELESSAFTFDFVFQKKQTVLGFTYYHSNNPTDSATDINTDTVVAAYSDSAVDYLMPYAVTANDSVSNLKLKSYDLTSVNGSCLWRNRMCIWGVQNNHNSLFFSEVDNFYYYPVPHNVALFDTNVISCIPYKDTLLVFTADKIYRVSENNDGTFTQSVVQNDMPLTQSDSAHLTAIKNMVLFKSGNYFYMIVPKSQSLTDELSVAPIYKNIAGFLNTLDKSVKEVLQLLYPEYLFNSCIVDSTPVSVYAEQDTIHILYNVSTNVCFLEDGKKQGGVSGVVRKFKLFLNYNTNLRAWTLYVEDTTAMSLEAAKLTDERLMAFVRINNKGFENEDVPFSIVAQRKADNSSHNFRMLLDTGCRTLSSAMQKRFREVQLKIYNEKEDVTSFCTAFLVDGVWRRNYSKLQETVLDNNIVSLMPVMDLNTFVTELSMPIQNSGEIIKDPGSDAIELNSWTLDFSHFKREAPTTIRIPVSGKGYSPRFIFMAPNAIGLTINEINWVYRLMYGR